MVEHFVCRSNFNAEGIGLRGAEVAGADVDIFVILAPLRVTEGIVWRSEGIVAL